MEVSPLTVLVRGVLEWACPDSFFEDLFDRQCRPRQWNRKLAISAIAWLMLAVVSGVRRSVFAAFQADQAQRGPHHHRHGGRVVRQVRPDRPRASPPPSSASPAARMHGLLTAAGVREPFGWEGYRVTMLDGTDLGGTEHRLKPLRRIKAAGLPGRFVAAYDLATGAGRRCGGQRGCLHLRAGVGPQHPGRSQTGPPLRRRPALLHDRDPVRDPGPPGSLRDPAAHELALASPAGGARSSAGSRPARSGSTDRGRGDRHGASGGGCGGSS